MQVAQYQEFVASKLKNGNDILSSLTGNKCNLLHLAMGVAGEAIEYEQAADNLDGDNALEELGDMLFFMEGLRIEFPQVIKALDNLPYSVTYVSGLLMDRIKKHVIYNKSLNEPLKGCRIILEQEIANYLTVLEEIVEAEAADWDTSTSFLRQANVDKLTKRYPAGYSDAAAQERADKKAGE